MAAARMSSADILAQLVAFDTVSRNSNLALIDWIADYLEGHGVASHRSLDASGSRANLHATIGPAAAGGIAFAGHVDTVPADEPEWTGDPFTLRREGDRLIGRGATDMKGFVACCLAAVPDLVASRPAAPVHLLITHDEEVTCDGARILVADLAARGVMPAWCVVGEPSSMRPIIAHKGRLAARATVRGLAGHSANPEIGVNAVQAAAEAVAWLAARARARAASGPFAPGFDPPYTTMQVGNIAGGGALNVIPQHARFEVEWRTVPGDDAAAEAAALRAHVAAEIEPRMHAVDPASGFTIETETALPPLGLQAAHGLAAEIAAITGHNAAGHVSYGTEAGIYQQAGIASIVCGPGDIARAHRPDEWIGRDELDDCDRFIRRFAERAGRSGG